MSFENDKQMNYKNSTSSIILLVQMLLQEYAKQRKLFSSSFFARKLFKSNKAVEEEHITVHTLKRDKTPETDLFIDWIAKDIPRLIEQKSLAGLSFDLYRDGPNIIENRPFETVMLRINYADNNTFSKNNEPGEENTLYMTRSYLETKKHMMTQVKSLVSRITLLKPLPSCYSISLKVLTNENLHTKPMKNSLMLSSSKLENSLFNHSAFFLDENKLATKFHQFKLCLFSSLEKNNFYPMPLLDGCTEKLSSSGTNDANKKAELRTRADMCDILTEKSLHKFLDGDVTAVNAETQLVCFDEIKRLVTQDKNMLNSQIFDGDITVNNCSDEKNKKVTAYISEDSYLKCGKKNACKSKTPDSISKKRKRTLIDFGLNLIETETGCFSKEIDLDTRSTMFQKSCEDKTKNGFHSKNLPKAIGKRKILITKKQLQSTNKKLKSTFAS